MLWTPKPPHGEALTLRAGRALEHEIRQCSLSHILAKKQPEREAYRALVERYCTECEKHPNFCHLERWLEACARQGFMSCTRNWLTAAQGPLESLCFWQRCKVFDCKTGTAPWKFFSKGAGNRVPRAAGTRAYRVGNGVRSSVCSLARLRCAAASLSTIVRSSAHRSACEFKPAT